MSYSKILALSAFPVIVAGCASANDPGPDAPLPVHDEDAPLISTDVDVEAGRACTIRSTLFGVGTAATAVATNCTLAAMVTGGVTLVCTAPAGALAILAVTGGTLAHMLSATTCAGRPVPKKTPVRVVLTPKCPNYQQIRKEIKEACGRNMYEDNPELECKIRGSNTCLIVGAAATRRAAAAKRCADARQQEQDQCWNKPHKNHEHAIATARKWERDCNECAGQGNNHPVIPGIVAVAGPACATGNILEVVYRAEFNSFACCRRDDPSADCINHSEKQKVSWGDSVCGRAGWRTATTIDFSMCGNVYRNTVIPEKCRDLVTKHETVLFGERASNCN
jgi:hypothetical protein